MDDRKDEKDSEDYVVLAHFVGVSRKLNDVAGRVVNVSVSVCSVVKTKSVVAKSRINESELKKLEKVINWQSKSEGKGSHTIQYSVKLR